MNSHYFVRNTPGTGVRQAAAPEFRRALAKAQPVARCRRLAQGVIGFMLIIGLLGVAGKYCWHHLGDNDRQAIAQTMVRLHIVL